MAVIIYEIFRGSMIEFDGRGVPKSVLVVTPHPDDSELGCGGTIAKWISQGAEVTYLLCTNGDKGSSDPSITSNELKRIRGQEIDEASKVLGVKNLVQLGYGDGELEDTSEFRERVVKNIRIFKPDVVMVTDPVRHKFYVHRDHRIAGQVVLDSLFPYARDRLHYIEHEAEGLTPHKVKTIMFWGSEAPDSYVDISAHLDTKIKALLEHKSQLSDNESENQMDDLIEAVASRAGAECGTKYAECFRTIQFTV